MIACKIFQGGGLNRQDKEVNQTLMKGILPSCL